MLPGTCRFSLAALALLLACGDDPPLGGTSASGGSTDGSTGEPGSTGAPTTGTSTTSTTSIKTTDVTTSSTGAPGSTGDASTGGTTTGDPDDPIVVPGLSHPESILWDKTADVYLISNINGDPGVADDNGFITRVNPEDGTVMALEWITGAGDIELNAPKGMAIVADTLYVADLTVVRKFDRNTGAPLGDIPVDGAMFLNDLSAAPSGEVYVSDTLTNSIHVVDPADQVTLLLSDPGLKNPNGLFAVNDGVYVCSYGDVRLLFVDRNMPQPLTVYMLPKGQLDGIARIPTGDWLITSWEEPGMFVIDSQLTPDSHSLPLPGIPSPADLDYDNKRDRALIPLLEQDRAEFHKYP
jgi:hypothetical protein